MRASPQKGSREPHEQRGRGVKRATGGDARARGRGVARGGACGVSHLHSATALKLGGGLSAQAPAAMPSKAPLPTLTLEAEAGKTMRSSEEEDANEDCTHAAAATGADEVMLRDGEVMTRWR